MTKRLVFEHRSQERRETEGEGVTRTKPMRHSIQLSNRILRKEHQSGPRRLSKRDHGIKRNAELAPSPPILVVYMRALFNVATLVALDQLKALLASKGWWLHKPDDPTVMAHKAAILRTVAPDDQLLVDHTFKFMLYDPINKTWILVNEPAENIFSFRVANPNSERVKLTCERLIEDLELTSNGHHKKPPTYELRGRIEVYMPRSADRAFSGVLVRTDRFQLALEEKRWELLTAYVLSVLSLILVALSFPAIANLWMPWLPDQVGPWLRGWFERVATTAGYSAGLVFLNVYFHYLNIRRKSRIEWSVQ